MTLIAVFSIKNFSNLFVGWHVISYWNLNLIVSLFQILLTNDKNLAIKARISDIFTFSKDKFQSDVNAVLKGDSKITLDSHKNEKTRNQSDTLLCQLKQILKDLLTAVSCDMMVNRLTKYSIWFKTYWLMNICRS